MTNYEVEAGTDINGSSGKVDVIFENILDKTTFEALLYDETNKAFVILFPNNKHSETIDTTKAQKLLDAIYSNKAQIYRAIYSNVSPKFFYVITDADAQNGTFNGYKININGTLASNTSIEYIDNEKMYEVSAKLTKELIMRIREKMTLNPTDATLNIRCVDKLLPGCPVPEEGDKFFNTKTNSLLTTKTDVKTYDELVLDGKLIKAAKILDAVTANGIYVVNTNTYYRVDGTSLTDITSVTSKVTAYPPATGNVAEEGRYYITGDKVYALAEGEVTGYTLNSISDGVYPAVQENNFYRFVNTPVADHEEIKLNTLYACTDGSSLTEINQSLVSNSGTIPVKEVAIADHYYVKDTECKFFTAGAYQDMGTVNTTSTVPDVTSPVFVKNRFFYNTTTKKLSYQIGEQPKVELTEETDFTFVDAIPPYFVTTAKLPVDGVTYVIIDYKNEQRSINAYKYTASTGEYTKLDLK